MSSLDKILAVIMGGGRGSRLYPLTRDRAKPAVPIAGKYRLIDIPISNCINSSILKIAVLTQFNSVSLHRHITQTYNFDAFHSGYVQIWAAEQTFGNEAWYQGTADAVRKQLFEIKSTRAEYVLILAGDHIYKMDYDKMAQHHWETGADITVAVQPASPVDASRFGLLKRTPGECWITDFVEKPKDPKVLKKFVSRDDPERPYIASMGNYFFKIDVLLEILENSTDDDFGGQVIPKALHTHKVCAFDFDGYWEDIGTIRSFYEVNLKLAAPDSPFDFHDAQHRIYSRPRFLPGTKVDGATLENVMIADGCNVGKAEIQNAVIGLRSQIKNGAVIRDTVLMGADYYDNPEDLKKGSGVPLGIGKNSVIEGALIDKNARIGDNVIIKPFPLGTEIDENDWVVNDGVVVIPKRAVIPAGTVIAPEPEKKVEKPRATNKMSESLSSGIYGLSFFLSLILIVLLWWTVVKSPEMRRFWVLIAAGWTMNLVADLAWGILYMIETEIWLDWIDYLYIARYLVVFLAFLLLPKVLNWQQSAITAAAMLVGGLLVWLLISRPAANPDPDYALGGLIFPVLDFGLIYTSWYRWKMADAPHQKVKLWIFLGMLAYGTANIFNYGLRITDPEADSIPALLLWLLTTVFVGVAVWFHRQSQQKKALA